MKEIKFKIGGFWAGITAVVIAAMLCGTAVFVSLQISQAQREVAEIQAKSMNESAEKINAGLDKLSEGICRGGGRIGC